MQVGRQVHNSRDKDTENETDLCVKKAAKDLPEVLGLAWLEARPSVFTLFKWVLPP